MKELGFDEALCQGKDGEELFKKIMAKKGFELKDVSDVKEYQDKDIDFIYEARNGKVQTFEVKRDTRIYETHNIFVEYIVVFKDKVEYSKGYLFKSEADILAYNDSHCKLFYIIDLPQLKKYVIENQRKFKIGRREDNMGRNGKEGRKYVCHGFLVYVGEINDGKIIKDIIRYDD